MSLVQRALRKDLQCGISGIGFSVGCNGFDIFIPGIFNHVDTPFRHVNKTTRIDIMGFRLPFNARVEVVLSPALDDVLPQFGIQVEMGPRLFPWFNPYEAHGEGLTAACEFVYPEMVNLGLWIGHGNTLPQNFYLIRFNINDDVFSTANTRAGDPATPSSLRGMAKNNTEFASTR